MQRRSRRARHISLALLLTVPAVSFALAVVTTTDARAARPGSELLACGSSDVLFVGQSESLDKTTFDGTPISELSGITYDRGSQTYYANADRVAADATSRVFTLAIPRSLDSVDVEVQGLAVLTRADGSPSTGGDLDAEGIAVAHNGTLYLASEGRAAAGSVLFPAEIRHYAPDGTLLGNVPVPTKFNVAPAGEAGSNLGLESMALSPNGRSLFTANERPLAGDGQTATFENRIRILRYDDRGAGGFVAAGEFFYLTDPDRAAGDIGVSELIALSESELLVLERGFVLGQGNTVRIYRVSLDGASDLTGESLASATPLEKTLLVDLATCPSGGATLPAGATQPNPLLDNFEAMTLGPILPGGLQTIVLLSDDNSAAIQTTRVVVLAVPRSELVP